MGEPPDADGALSRVRSVLAVCAHPDDESFGLGAALHHLGSQGSEVALLCFTHGEASTLGPSPRELGALRARELETAAAELGFGDVTLLDYHDGALAEVPLEELARRVATLAGRVAPDLLLVFDQQGVTGHPDHVRATAAALLGAPGVPALAWVIPKTVADALNEELHTTFLGREDPEIDIVVKVDREAQRRACYRHESQCTGNTVLWRRLELLGDQEAFSWLRRPSAPARP